MVQGVLYVIVLMHFACNSNERVFMKRVISVLLLGCLLLGSTDSYASSYSENSPADYSSGDIFVETDNDEVSEEDEGDVSFNDISADDVSENESEESEETEVALEIVSQPEDAVCLIGDEVTFSVETNREDVSYYWMYSKDGGETWVKCYNNGYNTNRLSLTAQIYMYGYKYKCIATSSNGETIQSDVANLCEATTAIVVQPENVTADTNEYVNFHVEAKGNKVSYRWYLSTDGGEKWYKCSTYTLFYSDGTQKSMTYDGYASDTLSFYVSRTHYNIQFKCVITDRVRNTVSSEAVKVNVPETVINVEPEDCEVFIGEKASFFAEANRSDVKYCWQYSKDNGVTWNKCLYNGYTTKTLSFDTAVYHYGYLFRCMVTDFKGNSIYTSAAKLTEKETEIVEQPVSPRASIGKTVTLSYKIKANKVNYRWYYSKDGGNTFIKCFSYAVYDENGKRTMVDYQGISESELSFVVTEENMSYVYRCIATDGHKDTFISDDVYIIDGTLIITKQPEDQYNLIGEKAVFSVEVNNEVKSYQWYFSKNNGSTWSQCAYTGGKTNQLSFDVVYQYGYMFYCGITDTDGNYVETDIVTLFEKESVIQEMPVGASVQSGEPVSFTVKAEGNKLTYCWYYSADGGNTWDKCSVFYTYSSNGIKVQKKYDGVMTDTLSFEAASSLDGYMYKCVIRDRRGTELVTDTILLEVEKEPSKYVVFESVNGKSYFDVDNKELLWASTGEDFVIEETASRISISSTLDLHCNSADILILHFYAKVGNSCGKINISINNKAYAATYPIQVSDTEYILPVSGITDINNLTITLTSGVQSIYFGNVEIWNIGNVRIRDIQTGAFDVSDGYSRNEISLYDGVGYLAYDLLYDGDYLYAIGKGDLVIYSVEEGGQPIPIGYMIGLGNAREISKHGDNCLVVSSRENGVFFVDVSDKSNPMIINNLLGHGLPTGVYVYGDYCFIASRRYGLEIYDISDVSNPKYCSSATYNSEEFYDCVVDGEYLYVTSWAERKIHIYSIKDVYNPTYVTTILTDGMSADLKIKDNILYLATGYHSRNNANTVLSPGYGTGNGLEIYDVSNPRNPKWQAAVKIDGRYYLSGFDHWGVEVSEGYAYLTSVTNGIFIIDVSDPKAPRKVANYYVKIPDSSNFYNTNDTDTYLFTYDSEHESRAIVTSAAVYDGKVWFSTSAGDRYSQGGNPQSGLYLIDFYGAETYVPNTEAVTLQGEAPTVQPIFSSSGDYVIRQVLSDKEYYAIAEYHGRYYCATGTNEIAVLDSGFNELFTVKTLGSTKDIVIKDGFCYCAETMQGLGVYRIENDNLAFVGRVRDTNYAATCTTLNLIGQNMILAQIGWTGYALVDITNPATPVFRTTVRTGTMYNRALSGCSESDEMQCVFDKKSVVWYRVSNGVPTLVSTLTNTRYSEDNGTVYSGGRAITITSKGYIYYDPLNLIQGDYNNLPVHRVQGAELSGMPVVYGKYLVVSSCFEKKITIVDIESINNPQLVAQFDVEGNPDEIEIGKNGDLLIPLHRGGIIVVTLRK